MYVETFKSICTIEKAWTNQTVLVCLRRRHSPPSLPPQALAVVTDEALLAVSPRIGHILKNPFNFLPPFRSFISFLFTLPMFLLRWMFGGGYIDRDGGGTGGGLAVGGGLRWWGVIRQFCWRKTRVWSMSVRGSVCGCVGV